MTDREIEVCVQLDGADVVAGRLWPHRRRTTESQTFTYDSGYLRRPGAYDLDPDLPLRSQQQQTPVGRTIFGAFSDSSPDRWGRRLIARAEQRRVRREGGAARSFGEIDYLLGVRDDLRQGALRFRLPGADGFLADDVTGVPALVDLPQLLRAADRDERDAATDADVVALLRGGSSLGGARPKAHVLDGTGRLAIAKFPSPVADEWDVMAWEAVALRLARDAGIRVPASELHRIEGMSVLVVDRFDRSGGRRVGYASAMTMLSAADGDQGSYLEIADVIERHSPRAAQDLRELWRRVAFSILISNFDDHLRNHGFLRSSTSGWTLAPAFDVNPDPHPGPRHLHTAIDFDDTEARIDTLMGIAAACRLGDADARATLGEVRDAVADWRSVATRMGIGAGETRRMAPAFEHDQALRADELTAGR